MVFLSDCGHRRQIKWEKEGKQRRTAGEENVEDKERERTTERKKGKERKIERKRERAIAKEKERLRHQMMR